MVFITAYGKAIQCDKAVKGKDYITIFLDGKEIQEDTGITDFSGYRLTDEDGNPAEFTAPELDEITKLQLAIAELYEGVLANG